MKFLASIISFLSIMIIRIRIFLLLSSFEVLQHQDWIQELEAALLLPFRWIRKRNHSVYFNKLQSSIQSNSKIGKLFKYLKMLDAIWINRENLDQVTKILSGHEWIAREIIFCQQNYFFYLYLWLARCKDKINSGNSPQKSQEYPLFPVITKNYSNEIEWSK